MKKITTVSENLTSWRWWAEWVGIFIGDAIMAAGFVFFINPYNIIPGGVYGASIVLHNLFPSIQVGTFGYCFDVPCSSSVCWCLERSWAAAPLWQRCSRPLS